MRTITTTEDLAAFCDAAKREAYVTIDTEFLRERTYWSKLCLIQMALPGAKGDAVLVDPIEGADMSMEPLYDLFRHEKTVKVFHAARQDLEIFFVEGNSFPKPLFDTQVAAMVCGFGEQVGYETLVRKIAHEPLDKTSRFTDWSRRPLSDAQKTYALADVTHLRVIYETLAKQLAETNRQKWVEEELAVLTDPETYTVRPHEAWQRIKTRTNSGRFLAIVKELARFREEHAQGNNVPRSRVIKDDALLERILRQLSLWDKRDNRIMELSGGMKRRVLIAKALAHEPRVLFLDEPTAGVDVELRRDMWEIVAGLKEAGVTIILTTHYIEEAEAIADRIGVINKGEILLVEEKTALMTRLGQKELRIELHDPVEALPEALADRGLRIEEGGQVLVYCYDTAQDRTGIATLIREVSEAGLVLRDLQTRQNSLEDIFVGLVSKQEDAA